MALNLSTNTFNNVFDLPIGRMAVVAGVGGTRGRSGAGRPVGLDEATEAS